MGDRTTLWAASDTVESTTEADAPELFARGTGYAVPLWLGLHLRELLFVGGLQRPEGPMWGVIVAVTLAVICWEWLMWRLGVPAVLAERWAEPRVWTALLSVAVGIALVFV
jgi:hypothetical protein